MVRSKLLFVVAVVLSSSAVMLGPVPAARAADPPKCEPEKLATKYPSLVGKKVVIGQDGESPPYSFRDPKNFNNIIGADADMVRAAFKCIGGQFEFKLGGWSGLLPAVIAGQADVMWDNLYFTTERAKQVDYVVYMIAGTGALVKKGNPKKITGMDSVCGLTATAGLGTVEEAAFRDQSKKCVAEGKAEINIFTAPDIPASTRLMQTGRADLFMNDLALIDILATDSNGQLERAVKIVSNFKIGVAIKKGRDDLVTALHDGLIIVQNDGTQKALYEKYKIDPSLAVPSEILKQ